tara:strand:+ start:564 stop:665 length:102 start_codon:yes stop_codon:yes gene_type:complete
MSQYKGVVMKKAPKKPAKKKMPAKTKQPKKYSY